MPSPAEYQLQYFRVRNALLGRHFAINRRGRVNVASLTTFLAATPSTPDDMTARWNVQEHQWENPLLWSGRLLPALAAEHELGNPGAEAILGLALESLASLYKFDNATGFGGYITRWDPVISDKPYLAPGTVASTEFLVDPRTRTYSYSVATTDPRHIQNRPDGILQVLLPDATVRAAYLETESTYFFDGRRWEPSMDELVGLLAAYSVIHELVPTAPLRAAVVGQVTRLGNYLAQHGYLLVRPGGGLTRRGSAGALSGLEQAFDAAFGRITGLPFARRADVAGALTQAGLWTVLQAPVLHEEGVFAALGALSAPILPALMAADGGIISGILGPVLSGTLTTAPLSLQQAMPYILLALPRSLALYFHRDAFDSAEDERSGPALAHLLASVPPDLCLNMLYDLFSRLPENSARTVRSFLPFTALSSLANPAATAGSGYLRLMRSRETSQVITGATDGVESCFASATAVLLGAGDREEARLVQLLSAQYETLSAQGDGGLELDGAAEKTEVGLDYLAGMALAWLHAARRSAAGRPVLTPGFPTPPAGPWPNVVVPGTVLAALPEVRAAVGTSATTDVNIFDAAFGAVLHKPAVPAPVLPASDSSRNPTEEVSVRVRDIDGDVDTGIVLNFGDEYEITATGTITAPELFAQPSGPEGWYVVDDARFALHAGIDAINGRKYALLGRLGGWFYVGARRPREPLYYHYPLRLYLRVNNDDQTKGSGTGAFHARVRVWRNTPNNAAVVSVNAPATVVRGERATASVTMRNNGSTTWTAANGYRLGSQAPQDNLTWGTNRIPLPQATGPGTDVTFTLTFAAPPAGTSPFSWRMVQDGVEWFGATTSPVGITTEASAQCPVIRGRILDLESEIAKLQEDLDAAAPGDKGKISGKIKALRKKVSDQTRLFQDLGCS